MHHFFVSPDSLHAGQCVLRGELVHQIRDVLRLRAGQEIVALDNSGAAFRVELVELERERICGKIIERVELNSEPRTRIVLYQALLKGEKFEWVLQKGTEIGIAEFVPLLTERTLVDKFSAAKEKRWRRILTEAAEQSRRAHIPNLCEPISLNDALRAARMQDALTLIPYEGESATGLREALIDKPTHVGLFIGPEGGFADDEIKRAKDSGACSVSLGPRILRAETAGLVAVSAILFACGEL